MFVLLFSDKRINLCINLIQSGKNDTSMERKHEKPDKK